MPWSRGDIEDLKDDYTEAQLIAFRKVISTHRMQPLAVINAALTETNFSYQITTAKDLSATLAAIRSAIKLHNSQPMEAPNQAHLMNFSTRSIE